jgi:hypothetical protein
LLERLKRFSRFVKEVRNLPSISVNLMLGATAGNDPFYTDVTRHFYKNATRRHIKFPFVKRLEYGFAVHRLSAEAGLYSHQVDSSARRNIKKAIRLGYRFERIDYNAHLADVTAVLRSAKVRQGRAMPNHLLRAEATPISDPKSSRPSHDYPYFGIFRGDTLVAYASCLIAGELCTIETIYGHAAFHADGIVPLLIASIGDNLSKSHSQVIYYAYDTYYGASDSMKRFKRKFLFRPHHVVWNLGE